MLTRVETGTGADSADRTDEDLSLLDLLLVLVRRRRFILQVSLVSAFLGLLLAFVLPTRYTATTAILPPQQSSSAGSALMAQLGSLGSMASLAGGGGALGMLKNPNDLQVALLKSRTVEDAMIDRFHLTQLYKEKYRSETRKDLEKWAEIENGAKDGLIRISVTDRDAQRAAQMANGYVEEFKRLTGGLAVTEASQRRLFFEQQLDGAKNQLATAEESLKQTEQQTGLVQLDTQARAVISSVAQLRAQIAAKEVQIGAIRSYATGQNPELQMAERELEGLQTQEQKLGASPTDGNMLPIPKGNIQQAGLEYVRKLRDVKYYETIFDLLARQYEVAKVDEARQGAVIQVVDRAVVPDRRSSPKRALIIAGATVLGFMFGVAWSFGAKARGRLEKNPAERSRLNALRAALS